MRMPSWTSLGRLLVTKNDDDIVGDVDLLPWISLLFLLLKLLGAAWTKKTSTSSRSAPPSL
jgi:hypothetical protein